MFFLLLSSEKGPIFWQTGELFECLPKNQKIDFLELATFSPPTDRFPPTKKKDNQPFTHKKLNKKFSEVCIIRLFDKFFLNWKKSCNLDAQDTFLIK